MAASHHAMAVRHIQNMTEAKVLEPHWGYADRALPCTNDPGSCQYLDSVYHSHDLGMLYTGIILGTIGTILLVWLVGRRSWSAFQHHKRTGLEDLISQPQTPRGTLDRLHRAVISSFRAWFLPEFARPIFGRTTRLQVTVLALLIGYLLIFTFVGIEYKHWITPVKNNPDLYNTRSGLGPFSDRVGVLAYALIPLSVLLSSRESLLSLVTGIPYQKFNFIHRWLGYVILVQSILHTVGWCIIEIRLYQPQPKVGIEWIKQKYMIWGIVAQLLLLLLFVFSLRPVIRLTGYEFFRKVHYVIAMVFIGACWAHWEPLKCFLLPSLLIWFVDRAARLVRTWLIHYRFCDAQIGFIQAQANIIVFHDHVNGDVVRLDFDFPHDAWDVGQHFYLCFPQLSIWQSHPFTPLSLPKANAANQTHSYIIRAKSGVTKMLSQIGGDRLSQSNQPKPEICSSVTTPVILTGPYGEKTLTNLETRTNVLCIAGDSGITYVLPVLLHLVQQSPVLDRKIELIWAVRMEDDIEWIRPELDMLQHNGNSHGIKLKIHITRDCCAPATTESGATFAKNLQLDSSSTSSNDEVQNMDEKGESVVANTAIRSADHMKHRPDLHISVTDFAEHTIRGSSTVFASGPGSMISDLRHAVASCNSKANVWKGDERYDVRLVCDDRLEW